MRRVLQGRAEGRPPPHTCCTSWMTSLLPGCVAAALSGLLATPPVDLVFSSVDQTVDTFAFVRWAGGDPWCSRSCVSLCVPCHGTHTIARDHFVQKKMRRWGSGVHSSGISEWIDSGDVVPVICMGTVTCNRRGPGGSCQSKSTGVARCGATGAVLPSALTTRTRTDECLAPDSTRVVRQRGQTHTDGCTA